MAEFSRIRHIDLIGPTAVGVHVTDENGRVRLGPIVINPNDFMIDFSTFLTALRAAGAVAPMDVEKLAQSWRRQRRQLRKELVESDPWCQRPSPAADLEGRLVCGDRQALQLMLWRRE